MDFSGRAIRIFAHTASSSRSAGFHSRTHQLCGRGSAPTALHHRLAIRRLAVRMPRLYFVRHGEAEHNPFIVKGKADGDDQVLREGRSILNPRLTAKGKAQAQALAAQLKDSGEVFDLCVTTPLARAIETAQLAFGSAANNFIVNPDGVETADPKLAGPQRGHSKADTIAAFPFVAEWDLSLIREDGDGANWVLGDAVEPTEPSGGR